MIRVGLAGWGDHDDLYAAGTAARDKLKEYAAHFSTVEVDSSFYAVQPEKNYAKWAEDTPADFAFIVKAYQGMTGHLRGKSPFGSEQEMFAAFRTSIEPLRQAGKLKAVLFQYPPWFDCTRENVARLREAKERMSGDMPLALEFRHQSWFTPQMRDKTLTFMREEGWIHSVCDEPQAGPGSVPAVLEATDERLTIVRFHGRNTGGWNSRDGGSNWRNVRYLYRYSEQELAEWKEQLDELQRQSGEIHVVFNNNSGGDAAANAKQLMAMLGLQVKEPAPKQLDLF